MKRFPLISLPSHLLQEIRELAKRANRGPQTVVQDLLEFGLHSKVIFPQEAIEFAKELQKTLIETEKRSVLVNSNEPVALLFQAHLRTPAQILYSTKSKSEGDGI